MELRKDNRFRFSLQWGNDTQERVLAGEFLEKLGNKKSDFIVMAIWEYLQQHPEAMAPGTKIKIMTQPLFSREQVLSEVRDLVRAYVEEAKLAIPADNTSSAQEAKQTGPSADDLNDMLENLAVFEQ